jgi:hypothetical protein
MCYAISSSQEEAIAPKHFSGFALATRLVITVPLRSRKKVGNPLNLPSLQVSLDASLVQLHPQWSPPY